MNLVAKAIKFATEKHGGQFRKFSSTPYVDHPKEVAFILLSVLETVNTEMLVAAILHDVAEDCYETIEEGIFTIKQEFGEAVGNLVDELTIRRAERKEMGKRAYMVRSMNNMSDKALTIKLSDRLHNIESLFDTGTGKDFIAWYSKETIYILDHLNRELNKEHTLLIGNIRALLSRTTT